MLLDAPVMPGSKAAQLQTNMRASDFRFEDTDQLDQILVDLCDMVVQGQRNNPNYHGLESCARPQRCAC